MLLPVVIGVLVLQAYHPLWRPHLQGDVVTFQLRAAHFLDNSSWAGLGYNEYQPGALWFFVLLGRLTPAVHNFDGFLTATVLANAALLAAHFAFFAWLGPRTAAPVFLALALAAGPILFHRFELLVSLIVLVAWLLFRFRSFAGAALLLGMAVAMKVYPAVLLPLVVVAAARRRREAGVLTAVAFAAGVAIPTGLYLVTGGTPTELVEALRFHQQKPVGLEGVVGTVVMLVQWTLGMPVRITPGFGVHGFTSDLPLLTNSVLELLWIVPTGLLFLAIVWRFRRRGLAHPAFAFALLLVFVVFAKVLNPQYLWWFLVFLPWIPPAWWGTLRWRAVLVAAIAALLLTQVVYPIFYSDYLAWFQQQFDSAALFYLGLLRNALLLVLLGLTLVALYRQLPARDRPAERGV
ncbi:MAG TPA: hypothetical protein VK992_02435, partial [Candidatus Caenarcaniphilales bacterium]|nr:hypothetical protein [Candidatus Caenarcaniphilales bacterium]